eukprot:COSAG01_NODE_14136_length_1492_cov_1.692749_1_plen_183_part_00
MEVLFGKYNPSGRMPVTTYPADYIRRSPFNMDLRADGGQTYMFYDNESYGPVLWPFGSGGSYTEFRYRNTTKLRSSMTATAFSGSVYEVKVTNIGHVAGATTVLGFVSSDQPGSPLRQLFAFDKVFLRPGESQLVALRMPPGSPGAATVAEDGALAVLPGRYTVSIEHLRWEHIVEGPPLQL